MLEEHGRRAPVVQLDGELGIAVQLEHRLAGIQLAALVQDAGRGRLVIVVVVDDPKAGLYYGSQVAAPLFSKIAAGALRLFNVPPDMVDNQKLRVAQANKNELHLDYE